MTSPLDVMTQAELQARLEGGPRELRLLVEALTSIVRARALRTLRRRKAHREHGLDSGQDAAELTQDVLMSLFANDAKALRAWEPSRGVPLAGFVGFIAEREIANVVASGRRRPWSETWAAGNGEELERGTRATCPERAVAASQIYEQVVARLQLETSLKGEQLFNLLFLEGREVADVVVRTGMSHHAIYAWRSRLTKALRRTLRDLDADVENASTFKTRRPSSRGEHR